MLCRACAALIQLMAAAEAGRDVLYITVDDNDLVEDMFHLHDLLTRRQITVGEELSLTDHFQSSNYLMLLFSTKCARFSTLAVVV